MNSDLQQFLNQVETNIEEPKHNLKATLNGRNIFRQSINPSALKFNQIIYSCRRLSIEKTKNFNEELITAFGPHIAKPTIIEVKLHAEICDTYGDFSTIVINNKSLEYEFGYSNFMYCGICMPLSVNINTTIHGDSYTCVEALVTSMSDPISTEEYNIMNLGI